MIDLHYWPTPNGHKITLFLEEAGLPYTVFPVDIGRGDQFLKTDHGFTVLRITTNQSVIVYGQAYPTGAPAASS